MIAPYIQNDSYRLLYVGEYNSGHAQAIKVLSMVRIEPPITLQTRYLNLWMH